MVHLTVTKCALMMLQFPFRVGRGTDTIVLNMSKTGMDSFCFSPMLVTMICIVYMFFIVCDTLGLSD